MEILSAINTFPKNLNWFRQNKVKRQRHIIKITALTVLLLFGASSTFAIEQYKLDQLKKDPQFAVSIAANGNYSGNSIELEIRSTNKRDVELLIPTGTVFYTSDEGDQILIVVEDQLVQITKGQTNRKTIDGFCTESSDGIPGSEMTMAFMPTKREQLQKLANFINENKGFEDHEIQEAVWCVSDKQSLANIYSEDPERSVKLTQFVADLTGQKATWNKVKRSHAQSGGFIQTAPLLVTGKVHFSTSKQSTLKSKIIDDDGNMLFESPRSTSIPKGDNVELNFNLTVSGWSKGIYSVVYFDQDNRIIVKKEFEI